MIDNKKKGNIGENLAEMFIINKGMNVLERNFKTEIGEIDIVALDKATLVFVEVKYRYNENFGVPAEAITFHKVRKINQVASQYILKHRLFNIEVRFDVIEIYADEKRINHIVNAFDSYLSY